MISHKTINLISTYSLVAPLYVLMVYFSFCIKKLLPVTLYIIFCLLAEVNSALTESYNFPDIILTNIYNLIEPSFVAWTVYTFIKDIRIRKIIIIIGTIHLLLWLLTISLTSLVITNPIITGSSTLCSILFCLLYIFQLNKEENIKVWQMIICGAFLSYFVTIAGMISFISFYKESSDEKYIIYFSIIHFIANLGLNGLLALGIYKCKNQSLLV